MNIRKVLELSTIIFLLFISLYSIGVLAKKDRIVQCGTIIDKVDSYTFRNKGRNVKSDREMIIKYDSGKYGSINPTVDTFYKLNVNDRGCFETDIREHSILIAFLVIFSAILSIIILFNIIKYSIGG